MSRPKVTHRAECAADGCRETARWQYDTQAERRNHLQHLRECPYRCTRHVKPDDVLSIDQAERQGVLVATRLPHLPDHLFWVPEGATTGSGFSFGPGFRAFAGDFPEGTRLVVTARIEVPE